MHSGIVFPKSQRANICIGFTCRNLWRAKYNVQNRVVMRSGSVSGPYWDPARILEQHLQGELTSYAITDDLLGSVVLAVKSIHLPIQEVPGSNPCWVVVWHQKTETQPGADLATIWAVFQTGARCGLRQARCMLRGRHFDDVFLPVDCPQEVFVPVIKAS